MAKLTAHAIAKTIAKRLKEKREERGLSLQDVADRSGLTKGHVWNLERGGAKNPTIETVVAISSALGVSLDYLIGLGKGEPVLHPAALRIACDVDELLRRSGKA